jgi:hypothetical protein
MVAVEAVVLEEIEVGPANDIVGATILGIVVCVGEIRGIGTKETTRETEIEGGMIPESDTTIGEIAPEFEAGGTTLASQGIIDEEDAVTPEITRGNVRFSLRKNKSNSRQVQGVNFQNIQLY